MSTRQDSIEERLTSLEEKLTTLQVRYLNGLIDNRIHTAIAHDDGER